MLQVLADPLRAVGAPPLTREGLVRHVAVGGLGTGGGDDIRQHGVHRMDIRGEGARLVGRQRTTVRAVIGDGPAVDLETADGELQGPHAERLRGGSHRAAVDTMDPGGAEIDDAVGPIRVHPAPDAVARFEDHDRPPRILQQPGRGQPRHARAHDHRVDLLHALLLAAPPH
ncbi:Uncharacterised protein [Mycobacterium tuberculosis]|nr:Uncharacterised protein [Mycobacterium tuberculosis]